MKAAKLNEMRRFEVLVEELDFPYEIPETSSLPVAGTTG